MKEKQLKFFHNIQEESKKIFRKRETITIHLDSVILLCIINFLLLFLSFSWGIERGKKVPQIVNNTPIIQEKKVEINEDLPIEYKDSIAIAQDKDTKTGKEKESEIKAYIVQVASYSKEKAAERERKFLENSGLSATVSKKGKYLVIYVGEFDNHNEAEKIKSKLRKRYIDCFVRKL